MKRSHSQALLPIFMLCLLLCLSGCGARQFHQDQELIDLQVYQPEKVYIGAILPQSGEDQQLGKNWQAAMEVAADIINNSHDIDWDVARSTGIANYGNAQVELVFGDCESNDMRTSGVADKILNLGVVAMVGAGRSEYTAMVGSRCRTADVALVSGCANSPALTDGETYTFGQWFNRISPNPEMESDLFFAYIKHLNQTQNANIKTLGVAYQNTVHSLRTLDVFYEKAAEAGLEILVSVGYNAMPENVTVETSRIVTAAPDVVVHIGEEGDAAMFLDGYVAAQYKPKLMLCYFGGYEDEALVEAVTRLGVNYVVGFSVSPELAPKNAPADEDSSSEPLSGNNAKSNSGSKTTVPGNSFTLNASQDEENTVSVQPVEVEGYNEIFPYIDNLYYQRTGQHMNGEALLEFSSVVVLAQAIGKCGSADRQLLQSVLKDNVFEAPYFFSGSVDFDELGQNIVMNGYLSTIDAEGRMVQVFKQ